jgi:hypothetical protein
MPLNCMTHIVQIITVVFLINKSFLQLNFLIGFNSIKGYIIICSRNMNKILNYTVTTNITVNTKLILQLNYPIDSNLIKD